MTTSGPVPKYNCVLFDWDGCLAQTLDLWMSSIEAAYATFGVDVTRAVVAANFGDWDSATRLGIRAGDVEAFYAHVSDAVDRALPSVDLYGGVAELLLELRSVGTKMGLVSSSQRHHIESAMKRHDIARYFDVVVTIEDVTHHKPHPESIERALAMLGASKDSAVMIGDSTKDLGAARNAGVDSVLVFPPEHEQIYEAATLRAANPTYECASFEDVRRVLFVER